MLKTLKYLLLVGVMSLTASIAVAVAAPSFADAKKASDMSIPEQVESWWYYDALGICAIKDQASWNYSDSAIKSGSWFEGGIDGVAYAVNVHGHYMSGIISDFGSSGKAGCRGSDSQIVKKALNLWGINSLDLVCGSGLMVRDNGSECEGGTGKFKFNKSRGERAGAIQSYIRQHVYDGNAPHLMDYMRYELYHGAFINECAPGQQARTTRPSGNLVYEVGELGSNGQMRTVYYIGTKDENHDVYIWADGREVSCGQLAQGTLPSSDYANAYAKRVEDNPDAAAPSEDREAEEGSGVAPTCAIDGIGWILCPVVNFMSMIVDGAYGAVSKFFLVVEPLSTSTSGNPMYSAWSVMRNLANLAFVVALLIIIFSHITSIGISNYSIKRMLPRIIVAAILVNTSYWIAAVAVDLSNIAGSSIKQLLDSTTASIGDTNDFSYLQTGGTGWQQLVGPVLAGGAAVGIGAAFSVNIWVALAALIPILITAVAAIVTALAVLVLRQALIIILIVVAPLAFVAFLLPNTEGLFSKWRSLLITMLVMYPAIALIFGGAALASHIIMLSASAVDPATDSNGKFLVQLMGAGVSVIPLFITPVIMKTAGGMLNRFAGIVNNSEKGAFDRLRNKSDGLRDDLRNRQREKRVGVGAGILEKASENGKKPSRFKRSYAWMRSGGQTGRINRDHKRNFNKALADEAEQEYFANRSINEDGFAENMVGKPPKNADEATINRLKNKTIALKSSARSTVDKIEEESIRNRELLYRSSFSPETALNEAAEAYRQAVMANDTTGARAAQRILLNGGSQGLKLLSKSITDIEADVDSDGNSAFSRNTSLRDDIKRDITAAGLKGKDNALNTWSYKEGTLSSRQMAEDTYKSLTPEELVGQIAPNLESARSYISQEVAQSILQNPNLQNKLDTDKLKIFREIAGVPSTPTTSGLGSNDGGVEGRLNIPRDQTSPNQPQPNTTPGIGAYQPVEQREQMMRTSMPSAANNMTQQPSGLWTPSGGGASRPRQRPTAPPPASPPTAPKPAAGAGSHIDSTGAMTPDTASEDYHDGMRK